MCSPAAVAGAAVYVVTRDEDLLSLDSYEGILILRPALALTVIRGENES
jgi:predicted nucleic acid-binding protein